ncbi:MAG: choice-of-anchor J domain-containing protein [Bacteroidetes bacterium]|nr:choice-of-anchor J domain-containing protein [Bacteroidota bacterium]
MKKYKFLSVSILLGALISCTNPEHYGVPNDSDLKDNCSDVTADLDVTEVTSAATGSYIKFADKDSIMEAYVTSSDEGGNFYKSISFVSKDGTVGFSMPIDDYNLYTKYEPGRLVYIQMRNRYFVKQNSSTVIGSLYNNGTPDDTFDDEVGRVSAIDYKTILTPSCSDYKAEEDLVQKMTIAEAKNDANLNKLIELDNVQFVETSLGKKYFDPTLNNLGSATNHTIQDIQGNELILRVSQYAGFAGESVPSSSGKILGVMTKYGSDYQFMVRTTRDVRLTNPNRLKILLNESFTGGIGSWVAFSVSGAQVWAQSASFGNPGACAKMSGFANSANNANEDWLISPAQDLSLLTNGATLTFDTATKFQGNALQVFISNNYPGSGTPNAAGVTWTPITATLSPINGNYVWTGSGDVNIDSFTGSGNSTVYVAFKYTSTTSASATWEVDNVKITPN